MKKKNRLLATTLAVFALPTLAIAQTETEPCSPYFEVHGEHLTDTFPLKESHAEVAITGTIAHVTLTQSYANLGEVPLDATYLFPSSTGASVHGMTMQIGERTIEAKIERKKEAQKQFEQAKRENKSASLLSQKRPNIFQMEIARILPGDELKLTLRYSEILTPRKGEYEFVLPTAIGPRYEKTTPQMEQINNPYLEKSIPDPTRFSLNLTLNSPLPVKNLSCPTHQATIKFLDKNKASLALAPTAPDRDVIVRYQLAQEKIASGLVLHKGEKENTFLLQIEPPLQPKSSDIPARDYLFVVDVSGSMSGFPLTLSKKLFRDLSATLRPIDTFNIVLFAGRSDLLSKKPLPATPKNIKNALALALLDKHSGSGGTELSSALKIALDLPSSRDVSRSLILITDGFISAEPAVFEMIKKNAGATNIFPLGVGDSVNRHLLDGIAHLAGNDSATVTHASEITEAVTRFREAISSPVLTGITITSDDLNISDLQPSRLPDLFAGRPLSLTGKWSGSPKGTLTIRGITGDGKTYEEKISFADAAADGKNLKNPALPILWARERVRQLADYADLTSDEKLIEEVTQLGLDYEILTAYTSFIAIDHEARDNQESAQKINQATSQPASHSGSGTSGSVPEPSAFLLVALTLLSTTFLRIRRAS